jgi:hypothetical protein
MPPPAQPPSSVPVQTVPTTTPPAKIPQTKLYSVRVLVTSSNQGVPAFNQGIYHDKLPVQNSANDRAIDGSGCGLCAWTCLAAAAGCCAPNFSADYSTMTAGTTPINPSSLLKYFSDYAIYKTPASEGANRKAAASKFANSNIFNVDGAGAMRNDNSAVADAIDALISSNHPGVTPACDNSQGGNGGQTGTDITGITQALVAGNPVILAVCFDSDAGSSHQVLAVGIASTIDGKSYYVINDSGFGNTDGFARLNNTKGTIGPISIGAATASPKRNPSTFHSHIAPWGYGSISSYRILGGLQPITGLSLKWLGPDGSWTTDPPSAGPSTTSK